MLSLTKYKTTPENRTGNVHSWPLKITAASSNVALSPKIFVYRSSSQGDPSIGDEYQCVSSIQQLTELPEDLPSEDKDGIKVSYYRKNSMEFHCRSAVELEALWDLIQEQAQDLVDNFKALSEVEESETVELS